MRPSRISFVASLCGSLGTVKSPFSRRKGSCSSIHSAFSPAFHQPSALTVSEVDIYLRIKITLSNLFSRHSFPTVLVSQQQNQTRCLQHLGHNIWRTHIARLLESLKFEAIFFIIIIVICPFGSFISNLPRAQALCLTVWPSLPGRGQPPVASVRF